MRHVAGELNVVSEIHVFSAMMTGPHFMNVGTFEQGRIWTPLWPVTCSRAKEKRH